MSKAMAQHGKLTAAFSIAIVTADDLFSSNSIKITNVSRCLECEIFKIFGNCHLKSSFAVVFKMTAANMKPFC